MGTRRRIDRVHPFAKRPRRARGAVLQPTLPGARHTRAGSHQGIAARLEHDVAVVDVAAQPERHRVQAVDRRAARALAECHVREGARRGGLLEQGVRRRGSKVALDPHHVAECVLGLERGRVEVG